MLSIDEIIKKYDLKNENKEKIKEFFNNSGLESFFYFLKELAKKTYNNSGSFEKENKSPGYSFLFLDNNKLNNNSNYYDKLFDNDLSRFQVKKKVYYGFANNFLENINDSHIDGILFYKYDSSIKEAYIEGNYFIPTIELNDLGNSRAASVLSASNNGFYSAMIRASDGNIYLFYDKNLILFYHTEDKELYLKNNFSKSKEKDSNESIYTKKIINFKEYYNSIFLKEKIV